MNKIHFIYIKRGQKSGRRLGPSVYHELRYEDLLQEPEETIIRLCQFLGEGYSDKVINFRPTTQRGKTLLLQKPIQKSNFNKWKTKLTHRQIQIFESIAGEALEKNGYERVTSSREISILETACYRGHNVLNNLIYRKKWVDLH